VRDRASFTGMPEPQIYKPRSAPEDAKQRAERREQWFRALNNEIVSRSDTWIISTPHAPQVILECLETSPMPAELIERGYKLKAEPDGERILPHAIAQPMVLSSSCAMVPATANTTAPVTMVITGAGIHATRRYSFSAP
jgi:hypothetical protein